MPDNADYPVMIRCPGCSYLVPQTWDTCRRCGTMIRAEAPVVAATAPPSAPPRPGPVAAPAPPIPPIGSRPVAPPLSNGNGQVVASAAPPAPPAVAPPPLTAPPLTALSLTAPPLTPPPVAAPPVAPPPLAPPRLAPPPLAPPPGAAAPASTAPPASAPVGPVDEFLPVRPVAHEVSPGPRDQEDLLPLVPVTVAKSKATDKLPRVALERKYWFIGGAVLALIVAIGIVYSVTKDDVKSQLDAPVEAVKKAEQVAGQSELNTAAMASQTVYADQGTFAHATPQALRAAEPSITWLPANRAATGPGQVSVRVIDADTMLLVTALPNKSCQALYQAPGGTTQVAAKPPCAAANVPIAGAAARTTAGG